jgi:hypothetical protein
MSDLHGTHVVASSHQPETLLRRLADGERVNAQVDWENVIDEVESVGGERLHAVKSSSSRRWCTSSRPDTGRRRAISRIVGARPARDAGNIDGQPPAEPLPLNRPLSLP